MQRPICSARYAGHRWKNESQDSRVTRSLEQGPPADEHCLGDGAELDGLAAAAEDLFARG